MELFVRVDDRLLHGRVICAWVPFVKADLLIVVSDEAATDSLRMAVMEACADDGLKVIVRSVQDIVSGDYGGNSGDGRGMLVVGSLKDAMRLYEGGFRFSSLNIGNVHHGDGGRKISLSVILNGEDEKLMERFESLGVKIDVRDVPMAEPVPYKK